MVSISESVISHCKELHVRVQGGKSLQEQISSSRHVSQPEYPCPWRSRNENPVSTMTVELDDPGASDATMGWGLHVFVLAVAVPV